MGYRSQSGESQFRGSTQPQQDNVGQQIVGSVVDVVGTELINIGKANRLRKEVNSQLAQESMNNQERLMNEIGGFGKVDGDSPEIGPDSKNLQDIFTGVVSELSKAQLNLSQHGNATYTYKYIDPNTGEESMRTREDDEAIINSNKNLIRGAQDFIGAHEYNIGVVETAIEEGKIGNDRGQTPLNKIDPYVYAAALAGNALNGQAVKERYFFEKDENGNRVMMIELKGQSIAQVNKARGVEGDTHVMNLKRLSEIQSSVSSLPNNSAGSNTAHDYTEQFNQSLQKAGAWKEGQFTENFYIDDPDEITDISGRTKITSKVKAFDYNAAEQQTDAIAKALSQQSAKGGPDQLLIDLAAYSVKTEDPETGEVVFSLVPGPEFNEDKESKKYGLILYNEDRSPKMKEPKRLLDDDGLFIQENFPGQKIEDVLKDVIQQSIMLDGGAYNSQEKIKVASSIIPDSDDSGGDRKLAKWEVVSKQNLSLIENASEELSGLTIEQMKDDPTMVEGVLESLLGISRNKANAVRVSNIKGVPTAVFVHQDSDGIDIEEFIPLDDMKKFQQRMQNISEVYELDDSGIPKLVQGVATAKPTDAVKLKETKASRALKSKNILKQGSKDTVAESFVDNILKIKVSDDETIGSLANAKGLNIEFSDENWTGFFGTRELIIGDVKLDLGPLDKKPTTAAEIKENKEDIKVIQNRILEILEEQDLYKKTK